MVNEENPYWRKLRLTSYILGGISIALEAIFIPILLATRNDFSYLYVTISAFIIAVIAAVPFVDVVTTMLDESIPLTTSEFDEWGNPKIEKYYHYMLAYSPYDQVEAKDYPALLVTTGLHDSQVQYWEPAKWVAKLRELKTDDNLLIFHINMDYGHGGASGRFEWIKETALEYAFIFDQLGIKE